MPRIVVNKKFGGFSLSDYAVLLLEREGIDCQRGRRDDNEFRTDPKVIEVVEKLGQKANGSAAALVVVDVPDDVQWYIDGFDGVETVREHHRMW